MRFIGRVLRYLFWVLVVSWAVALLRKLVGQMAYPGANAPRDMEVPNDAVAKKLVRDPVCGLHIAEGLALPLKQGNDIVHFCSAECRDTYVSQRRKFAANE